MKKANGEGYLGSKLLQFSPRGDKSETIKGTRDPKAARRAPKMTPKKPKERQWEDENLHIEEKRRQNRSR